MTRFLQMVIFWIGLISPFAIVAQVDAKQGDANQSDAKQIDDVKASVAISVQQEQEIWAGQQVTLNLDLKTTGFSFANSRFNLPEVNGAFLMQTDTTTIKMSEKIDGETWQIVRYPLALYPQKAGQLEIPSINVRFQTSAGFGSAERAFEFQTETLELSIKMPPGVKEGDLVVTTSSFEIEHDWQPQTGAANTGDAITLTVTRRADEISAMLLPPLPVYRAAGLAAYPQAPKVTDKTNRGDLTGERIDTIIWVVEKPGTYDIPGIRFQWWDPGSSELKQQIIPGMNLDILSSSKDKAAGNTGDKPGQSGSVFPWWLIAIITALASAYLWFRFNDRTSAQPVDTEKSTFASLQQACSINHPGRAYSALHEWLVYLEPAAYPSPRPITLNGFARSWGDTQLTSELAGLQEALVSSNNNWQGNHLIDSLRRIRKKTIKLQTDHSKACLAPLNP